VRQVGEDAPAATLRFVVKPDVQSRAFAISTGVPTSAPAARDGIPVDHPAEAADRLRRELVNRAQK
jgi:hypothetical protein